ncbi:MAG: redox-sensing transcriptional repressor Rex [Spirochaetales bacterium]|jgi:redox-sensing transcriptional repressor|nr:redox-sensing transcriptional repressor Rex [Spirochaetales bacterium]
MGNLRIAAVPSVRRLPSYLHIIRDAQAEGGEYISGTVIAGELKLEAIQVRKDLAITGIIGRPKKGYPIKPLIKAIESFLGWDSRRDAVLVGVGNLGSALLGYQEFSRHGLNFVAAFDNNPKKIGAGIHSLKIMSARNMAAQIRGFGVKTAVLTVPSSYAQETANILVEAGIEGIWNFTNRKLKVPDHVVVQKEDLSSGYAMLCVTMNASRKGKKSGSA